MDELPEEQKKRLEKKAVSDISLIALEHGVKIETASNKLIKLLMGIYTGGMITGLEEARIIMTEADKKEIEEFKNRPPCYPGSSGPGCGCDTAVGDECNECPYNCHGQSFKE